MSTQHIGLTSLHQKVEYVINLISKKEEILISYKGKVFCKLVPLDTAVSFNAGDDIEA